MSPPRALLPRRGAHAPVRAAVRALLSMLRRARCPPRAGVRAVSAATACAFQTPRLDFSFVSE
eukprot:6209079-Pleurochrysis_carterae.AAC.3